MSNTNAERQFMVATEDAPLTDAERADMDAKYAAAAARKLPTVEQTVEAIKREILADIGTAVSSSGQVMPATVSTFSELHDYVDANTYGGMCDTLADLMDSFQSDEANEAWMIHCNKATDIVDAWLRAGRPEATVQIPLSAAAYTSRTFDATYDSFRGRTPDGFRFDITASWQNPTIGSPVVTTLARDEALAREIVAALEAAV